ncbi:MAG: hypothetical protein J6T15_03905 [Bacilli bacterium]|nr:hypothetical protein [Bacilli bacterium]
MKKNNTRIVGVTIDTKSKNTQDKVYYYKTTERLQDGERIRVGVPSGGFPNATVVDTNNKSKHSMRIKELDIKG